MVIYDEYGLGLRCKACNEVLTSTESSKKDKEHQYYDLCTKCLYYNEFDEDEVYGDVPFLPDMDKYEE